mmetsp:Transcript_98353/g.194950  ORF Transcript_98353/g.194950 Transcript_98353/m.194950 type:complete len:311 (-) Transcript_98353:1390-2322(-)
MSSQHSGPNLAGASFESLVPSPAVPTSDQRQTSLVREATNDSFNFGRCCRSIAVRPCAPVVPEGRRASGGGSVSMPPPARWPTKKGMRSGKAFRKSCSYKLPGFAACLPSSSNNESRKAVSCGFEAPKYHNILDHEDTQAVAVPGRCNSMSSKNEGSPAAARASGHAALMALKAEPRAVLGRRPSREAVSGIDMVPSVSLLGSLSSPLESAASRAVTLTNLLSSSLLSRVDDSVPRSVPLFRALQDQRRSSECNAEAARAVPASTRRSEPMLPAEDEDATPEAVGLFSRRVGPISSRKLNAATKRILAWY